MAGHNQKKTTERRDSYVKTQQQRKNSGAKKTSPNLNKILDPKAQQAAGAAILSVVNSPQLGTPQQQNSDGFNRDRLVEFLNMRFSDALTAYHDTNLDPSMRPEKYESVKPAPTTTAWGKNSNGIPSAWSQPPQIKANNTGGDTTGVMSNGVDFLVELAKK